MTQTFWIIFCQEIFLSMQSLEKILANFLFFLISVVVFFLLFSSEQNQHLQLVAIALFSLTSALIFSSTDFLKKDFDDGTIEQMLARCEDFEIFILAKNLSYWLVSALPILLLLPLIAFVIGLEFDLIVRFLLLSFLASLSISFVCGFCGSLSTLQNSAPLVAIIAMPLIIPSLLIVQSGMVDVNSFESAYKILLGITILSLNLSVFASAKIVKIAAD